MSKLDVQALSTLSGLPGRAYLAGPAWPDLLGGDQPLLTVELGQDADLVISRCLAPA